MSTPVPTYQIRAPDPFSCAERNRYAAWREWSKLFKTYAIAARLRTAEKDEQVCALTLAAGKELMPIYASHIEPTVKNTDGYEEVLGKIEAYFRNDINLTQSRYEFLNSKQEARSLETFMVALRNKVDECEFCRSCASSLIASTFLTGLDDSECRRHLLTKGSKATAGPDETLKLAKEFASSKRIETQLGSSDAPLHAIQQRASPRRNFQRKPANRNNPRNAICSKGCRSHPDGQCRARNATCHRCKRRGHFSNVCEAAHSIEEPESEDTERTDMIALQEFRLDSIRGLRQLSDQDDTWWQELLITDSEKRINFKLDTGATISVLPWRIFKKTPKQRKVDQNDEENHLILRA